jgi:hypothetical protein
VLLLLEEALGSKPYICEARKNPEIAYAGDRKAIKSSLQVVH